MKLFTKRKISFKKSLFVWGLCACCITNSINFGYAASQKSLAIGAGAALAAEATALGTKWMLGRDGNQLTQEQIDKNPELKPLEGRVIISLKDGRKIGYGEPGVTQVNGNRVLGTVLQVGSCRDQIVSLQIPASVTDISEFFEWRNLESVIFEEGSELREIQQCAFCNCLSLQSIIIPASVNSIGAWAFQDCSNLTNVIFEEGSAITCIEYATFLRCKALKDVQLPQQLERIEDVAFTKAGNGSLVIPATVSYIGGAFSHSGFTSIVFEEGSTVEHIAPWTFSNCKALKEVRLPQGLKIIERNAFNGAALESIKIPDTVSNIGSSAFFDSKLLNIQFGPNFPLEATGFQEITDFLNNIFTGDDYEYEEYRDMFLVTRNVLKVPTGCVVNFAGDPPVRFKYSSDLQKTWNRIEA